MNRRDIFDAVELELDFGIKKFGHFHSHHEAYAVLKEEVDEYWDDVKVNNVQREELIQIAAMAIKAAMLCG